jgi:hypothetical protein
MKKQQKTFTFHYPLNKRVWLNGRNQNTVVGILHIEAVGYFNPNESLLSDERYSVDIESVEFKGTDIREVLEALDRMEEITEEAIRRVSEQFNQMEAA